MCQSCGFDEPQGNPLGEAAVSSHQRKIPGGLYPQACYRRTGGDDILTDDRPELARSRRNKGIANASLSGEEP
jgi:hypothetical protein